MIHLVATEGPHWLQWTGVWNEAGPWYGFWSGIAGCLTYLGVVLVVYRLFRCKSCLRPAFHHKVPGTSYRTCSKHSTIAHHAKLLAKHRAKYPNHITHNQEAA